MPVMRQPAASLADILLQHIGAIRNRTCLPLGRVLRIQLGISDDSAYFQEEIRQKLVPISHLQGMMLDWTQQYSPEIAELKDGTASGRTMQFVFPRGVNVPPRIQDPRFRKLNVNDADPPTMRQDVEHYASGFILDRSGTKYYVLQPIEQICVQPYGVPTLLLLYGRTNPWNGTKVAFLFSPKTKTGFLVHGQLGFDR